MNPIRLTSGASSYRLALVVALALAPLPTEAQGQQRARVEWELQGIRQTQFNNYFQALNEMNDLRRYGCEVQLGQVNGAYIVSYSLRGRQSHRYAVYQGAIQTADWLRQRGFTVYVIPY